MNERIRELMIQSNPHGDFKDCEWVFEKFAELIVRECCVAIAEKTDRTHIYTSFDRGLVEGTVERSIRAVKTYFGV